MTKRALATAFAVSVLLWSALAWAGRLDPEVDAQLSALPPGGTLSVIVEMRDQADAASAAATAWGRARRARGLAVVTALQSHANQSQGSIRADLAREQARGAVLRVIPFWIFNGLAVTATDSVIRSLAARPDVQEVRLDAPIPPPSPVLSGAVPAATANEWNIDRIRASEVWALDPAYDGEGTVVGSFDTGVDGTHPDLAPRYRGNDAISWFDPYGEHASPYDAHGHGTHTTGTAVGGDASGTNIGVAPGAKWIAAKGWNDEGISTTSAFHQIFQWFLAPGGDPANAPDVVNHSWGISQSGCIKEFLADVKAMRAAGIFPAFASGNTGPLARSVRAPGAHPESFAVGATDFFDTIASFSGRGPSPCDRSIKPDVSAPGVGITSTVPGGYLTFDGTSMATPHVTGAVAVLRSINPALTVDQLEAALTQGAVDLGTAGPDNSYGVGRLDLFTSAQIVLDPNRPIVTITATDPTATEASLTTGTLTVSRTGSTAADVTVSYTVGGTATAGSDYVALSGTVIIPAGSATATIVVTPMDDALFEGDETVIVTLSADAAYIVGSPGSAAVTITSDELPPDLIISALSAPSSATANATVSVNETTKNQGTGDVTVSTWTRLYLSTNSTWDSADILLASRSIASLAAGATDSAITQVTVPAGTTPGNYHILAFADASGVAAEGDEGNNSTATLIQISASSPDLIISALSAPGSATAGATIAVNETTKNQGTADVTVSTWTRLYLSTNSTWDSADILLAGRSIASLAAGATSSATTQVTIPASTAAGTYYILAFADASGAVAESNESNNSTATPVQISASNAADLIISALSAPSSATAGATLSVNETTKNQGTGDVTVSTWTRLYLSTNSTWDSADFLLAGRSIASLAAGATSSATTQVTIPASTAAGKYYILAFADASGAAAESNESNNSAATPIQISASRPDLIISALSAPASTTAGATLSVNETTKNQGTADVTVSTWTRLYLSTNTTWDSADILLASRSIASLAAGATDSATTQVTIPASTAAGNYYILAFTDASGAVSESNESNNSAATLIQISADN